MKYVRFRGAGNDALSGIVEGDVVRVMVGSPFEPLQFSGAVLPLAGIRPLAPCFPTKMLAVGLNYKSHIQDRPEPKAPGIFYKAISALLPHEGVIRLPKDAGPVHYEGELVVVIGRRARNVPESQALEYVFGYTCGNDVSARQWQANDLQWWRAKGADTFAPLGPWIVTDLDPSNLTLQLRLNGKVKQETSTSLLIHSVPSLISFISRYVTLEQGDVIYTGTPGKTEALSPRDTVEVEISGIGVLRNQVAEEEEFLSPLSAQLRSLLDPR